MKRFSSPLLTLLMLVGAPALALDYRVRSGDSLSEIAARFGVSVQEIQRANGLSTTRIRVGDMLRIPVREERRSEPARVNGTYVVRSGDTLSEIAAAHGLSLSALLQANSLGARSAIRPGQILAIPGGGSGASGARAPSQPAQPERSPRAVHAPMRVPEAHVEVLARIVKGESWPDSSFEGKVAVAATVLNRVRSGRFPSTIPGVAHQPQQFSCYNPEFRRRLYHGPIPDWAWRAARAALAGEDPTGNATHYYNPYLVRPPWARRLTPTVRIGTSRLDTHAFYR